MKDMGYKEAGIPHEQLNIKLNYCTSEKEWNELKNLLNINDKDKNPELDFSSKLTSAGEKINEAADNVKDTLVDAKDIATKVVDWVADFGKNPFGTILSTLMDFLGEVGDAIQWLANTIQMNESNKVKYTYNFLKDKNGTGKDQYTRVGKYESGAKVVTGVDIKKDMNELGYDTENLSFQAIPLSVDAMKKLRDQELNNGLLEKGKTNEPTSEDEAYFIYAYQENTGIPVFHELMSVAKQMSDDSPDNAPVQAIYSARGLESLTIDYIYNFKNEQNTVALKPFDEIASVVEEKYDNILNDVNYEVTRAKLYEHVYTGEDQKYAEEPIWYFEVMENGSNKTVMLVNAETGKEINLPS